MGAVVVDMSHRLEVERPGGAKGAWIVRPLTYREFIDFCKRTNDAAKDPDADPASGIRQQMEVCSAAVVAYRIDGKEHPVTPELLEGASLADISACFNAIMGLSKLEAETAGN